MSQMEQRLKSWARKRLSDETIDRVLALRSRAKVGSTGSVVSVVVPTYNEGDHLEDTLRSLNRQSYESLEIVVVDDGSTDNSLSVAEAFAKRDKRVKVTSQPNAGLGAARNTGVSLATGEYLMFVDAGDELPRHAIRNMAKVLQKSESDFVAGIIQKYDFRVRWVQDWRKDLYQIDRTRTTLAEFPGIVQDEFVTNKLYVRSFYDEHLGPFPEGIRYEDQELALRAYSRATAFDVLGEVIYVWRFFEHQSSITQTKWKQVDLVDRLGVKERLLPNLENVLDHDSFVKQKARLVGEDMRDYYVNVVRTPPEYFDTIQAFLAEQLDPDDPEVWNQMRVPARLQTWLALHGKPEDLAHVIAEFERWGTSLVSAEIDGTWNVKPHFLTELETDLPTWLLELQPCDIQPYVELTSTRWTDPTTCLVEGLAYLSSLPTELATISARLETLDGRTVSDEIAIKPLTSPIFRTSSRDSFVDRSDSGFEAVIKLDLDSVQQALQTGDELRLTIVVEGLGFERLVRIPVIRRSGYVPPPNADLDSFKQYSHRISLDRGLTFSAHDVIANVENLSIDQGRIQLTVRDHEASSSRQLELKASSLRSVRTLDSLSLPAEFCGASVSAGTGVAIDRDAKGRAALLDFKDGVFATGVAYKDNGGALSVTGVNGIDCVPDSLVLVKGGTRIEAQEFEWNHDQRTFSAVFILDDEFRRRASGFFQLYLTSSDGSAVDSPIRTLDGIPTPTTAEEREFGISVRPTPGRKALRFLINRSVLLGMNTSYDRWQVVNAARNKGRERLEDAVLFESFHGKTTTDSPRAILEELQARNTSLKIYVAQENGTVEVPEGTTGVIVNSDEYIEVLHTSKFLINNSDFPDYYRKSPGQYYLQTWHGTPLKRIANDVPPASLSFNYRELMSQEVKVWDLMLAQNEYSADVFRSAFGYQGPMAVEGYPRNDTLVDDQAEELRATTRARLGIADEAFVVLYAPTWRDQTRNAVGRHKLVSFLDFDQAKVGIEAPVEFLLRGHSNTDSTEQQNPVAIDVSTDSDLNGLMVACDVMITDYSSIMFDYCATGKPIGFLVPDIEEYGGTTRGFYFDLASEAPGPLMNNTQEVIEFLERVRAGSWQPDQRYKDFVNKFCALDDGHATRRVLDLTPMSAYIDPAN